MFVKELFVYGFTQTYCWESVHKLSWLDSGYLLRNHVVVKHVMRSSFRIYHCRSEYKMMVINKTINRFGYL